MRKQHYVIVLVVFALLVLASIALRGGGDGLLVQWLKALHGQ